jgi:hypothetical protein
MAHSRLAGAIAVLLGVALIAAGLRLVPAALHRHAAGARLDRVAAADAPGRADLAALTRHSRRALALAGRPVDTRRLALAAQARERPDRAVRHLTATVRRAPGDAVAWTRLAALRHRLGDRGASLAALVQALGAAPSMRHLAPVRAELILRRWPDVSARVPVAVLERQIRLAHERAPDVLARVAEGTGRTWLVRAARTGGIPRP